MAFSKAHERNLVDAVRAHPCAETVNRLFDYWRVKKDALLSLLPVRK